MKQKYMAGITACSNGLSKEKKQELHQLAEILEQNGILIRTSRYLYEKSDGISASGPEKAKELMGFFQDSQIGQIFDVSGGDMANEILSDLDYDKIKTSPAVFWGYSDLTVILNAIYAKTGKKSVLYQIRNLLYDHKEEQEKQLFGYLTERNEDLFLLKGRFVQRNQMEGTVVGGNIRCFLKLAGTPYFPDVRGRVLFLEARSGLVPQMTTFFSQLRQMGVLDQIRGLILGTFSQMETASKDIASLALRYADPDMPVFKTNQAGHGTDSKALIIGGHVSMVDKNHLMTRN